MRLGKKVRAFFKLIRPLQVFMSMLICASTLLLFQSQKGTYSLELMGVAVLAVALILAGGTAMNDYFDFEADAIAWPEKPIPSKLLSPTEVAQFTAVMFVGTLVVALTINPLAFGVAVFWVIFSILYSSFFKRVSGFVSNLVIGFLVGSIPLFSEVVVFQRVSLMSLSFLGASLAVAGYDDLKDVVTVEADRKVGYPTLAVTRGIRTAAIVGALYFPLAIIASTIPYFLGVVTIAYIIVMALLGCIDLYLIWPILKEPDIQHVEKQYKPLTASLILFPIAVISGTFLLH